MALDFYSALDQMANPTQDLGGGPGAGGDARAMAQLILGGGQASIQDPTTGAMVPFMGAGANSKAAGLSPDFQQILAEAEKMAAGARGDFLQKGAVAGGGQGNSLTANPYAQGSFDPTNQSSVAAVQAQGNSPQAMTQDQINAQIQAYANGQPAPDNTPAAAPGAPAQAQAGTLVANPYGPGSFNPADPAQVAALKTQAASQKQFENAQQVIKQLIGDRPSTDVGTIMQELLAAAPDANAADAIRRNGIQLAAQLSTQRENAYNQRQQAVNPLVKNILESVGVGGTNKFKDAFEASLGRTLGEKAGGKGGDTLPQKLMQSIGKDDFDQNMADAMATGKLTPTQQLQLERMHQTAYAKNEVGDRDQKLLTGTELAYRNIDRIEQAYKNTEAYKTGKASDTFRLALALTKQGASAEQLAPYLTKLSPEERNFVSQYNLFGINVRQVAQDSRMSNFDSERVLNAVGNPVVGKDLFMSQLGAMKQELADRHDQLLTDVGKRGKRIGEFSPINKTAAATPAPVPPGKVRVVKADGTSGFIPAGQLDEALKAGYKRG